MKYKDVEDAVILRVKEAMPYLRYVDTYQGELEESKITQLAVNFPAALIFLGKAEGADRGYPMKWQKVECGILVCDRNLRGSKSARHGDARNPGTYQMLEDLFTTLYNQDLGLEMHPFDWEGDEAIINTAKFSIYQAVYLTQYAKN